MTTEQPQAGRELDDEVLTVIVSGLGPPDADGYRAFVREVVKIPKGGTEVVTSRSFPAGSLISLRIQDSEIVADPKERLRMPLEDAGEQVGGGIDPTIRINL